MIAHTISAAGSAAAFAAGGLCLGLGYFVLLRWSVTAIGVAGRRGQILALTSLRLGAAIAFFVLAARLGGALTLLSGFAGFLTARTLALRQRRNGR